MFSNFSCDRIFFLVSSQNNRLYNDETIEKIMLLLLRLVERILERRLITFDFEINGAHF
jgi:hypothetical protein